MASGYKKTGYEIHAEDKTGPGTASAKRNLQSVGEQLRGLQNIAIGALGVDQLAGALSAVHASALEAEKSTAALNAVLKATGGSAGLTRRQIEGLVDELAGSTLFDDDAIREAAAALLRFRDIQEDVFTDALRMAPDLATALNTDVVSAAQTLGKALVNPETGLKGLRAAGLNLAPQLEDTAKKFLEVGDHAGAAQVVLDELKKSIGGAAGEANTGLLKATADTKKAWNELLEAIGNTQSYQESTSAFLGGLKALFADIKTEIEGGHSNLRGFVGYLWDSLPIISQIRTVAGLSMEEMLKKKGGVFNAAPGVKTGWDLIDPKFDPKRQEEERAAKEAADKRRKEQQDEVEYERKKKLAEEARKRAEQAARQRTGFVDSLQKERDKLLLGDEESKLKEAETLGIKGEALERVKALTREIAERKALLDAAKRNNEEFDKEIRAIDARDEAIEKMIRSERENAEAQQLEYDLLRESEPVRRARVAMLEAERLGIERNSDAWNQLYDSTLQAEEQRDAIRKVNDEIKRGEAFARDFGLTFQSAAEDAILEGKNLLEVVQALGKDIARMALRKTFTEPLGNAFSGWLSGLTSGGGAAGSWAPSEGLDFFVPSANGNAFDAAGVIPFARGGVVTRPTLFPFAKGTGLMGEAGPEAILPLRRGKAGRLGVEVAGGGGADVTVNIINQSGSVNITRRESMIDGARQIEVFINDKVNAMVDRGGMDASMGRAFGARRVGVLRG